MAMKPLVIFLGNPILADDRIGISLGETLRAKLESEGYDVQILEKTGFSLIDYLENREEAVIVDSVKTKKHEVGDIIPLSLEDLCQYAPFTSHYVGLPDTLRLMKELGLKPPKHLHILGIEVDDPYAISEKMSAKLTEKLKMLSQEIHTLISSSVLHSSKQEHWHRRRREC